MNNLKKTILNFRLLFLKQKLNKNNKSEDGCKNILSILLITFLTVAVIAQAIVLGHVLGDGTLTKDFRLTLSPTIAIVFFIILLRLTLKNKTKIAAFIFLLTLFLLMLKSSMAAGADSPQSIVIYCLIITMSGILIGPGFAIVSAGIICLSLLSLFLLHENNFIDYSNNWRIDVFGMADVVVLLLSYMIIAIVSWLFGNEIARALKRARRSEMEALALAKELQKEKNSLEIKVEKRTKELRESQLKELTQIGNLAEFGMLSAGLLHDIKNPLTVISLNLDSLRNSPKSKTLELINKSLLAAKTAEMIIKSSQNRLILEEEKQKFDLIFEIKNSLVLVEHRANREKIQIVIDGPKKLIMNGYLSRLLRVSINLVMNAIDSFDGIERAVRRVDIKVIKKKTKIIVEVIDNGSGIREKDKPNIFQPLFSKKENGDRMGLGLYSSKKIIKDYFGGDIVFESVLGVGTKFSVIMPRQ